MRRNTIPGGRITGLALSLVLLLALGSSACLVKMSSGPRETADGKKLNPFAYVNTENNVAVVVGTKIARHSNSDEVVPLQILVRNDSAEVIHVDAANFIVRDAEGYEYAPMTPEALKETYSRVNFDWELAETTEFIYLLNSGIADSDNLATNFYPHSSNRLVIDHLDLKASSRIVDMLYFRIPGWRELNEPLTMVVKNLRDQPPLEVKFSLPSR